MFAGVIKPGLDSRNRNLEDLSDRGHSQSFEVKHGQKCTVLAIEAMERLSHGQSAVALPVGGCRRLSRGS